MPVLSADNFFSRGSSRFRNARPLRFRSNLAPSSRCPIGLAHEYSIKFMSRRQNWKMMSMGSLSEPKELTIRANGATSRDARHDVQ
jgi:hypothetical protein